MSHDDALAQVRRAGDEFAARPDPVAARRRGDRMRRRRRVLGTAVSGGLAATVAAVAFAIVATDDGSELEVINPPTSTFVPSPTTVPELPPTTEDPPVSDTPAWRPAIAPLRGDVVAVDEVRGALTIVTAGEEASVVPVLARIGAAESARLGALTVTRDGRYALVTVWEESDGPSIWQVALEGGGMPTLLVENAANPAVSPDGSTVAYGGATDGVVDRIVLLDLASGEERVLRSTQPPSPVGGGPGLLAWAPDDRRLAFEAWGVDNSAVFVLDTNTAASLDDAEVAVGGSMHTPSFVDDDEIIGVDNDGGWFGPVRAERFSTGAVAVLEGLGSPAQLAVNPLDGRILVVGWPTDEHGDRPLLVSDGDGRLVAVATSISHAAWRTPLA